MSNPQETTAELIDSLKNPTTEHRYFKRMGLDRWVFGIAAVLAVAFVAWGFISPAGLGAVADVLLAGTMNRPVAVRHRGGLLRSCRHRRGLRFGHSAGRDDEC